MAIIEPVRRDIQEPGKVKKYSSALRLWHWLSAIVITGSILTVFLNSTLTNKRGNANIIQTELAKEKVSITTSEAMRASHAINDNTWALHTYFGYMLAALFLFRLVLEFFQLADQKLIGKIKSAYNHYYILKKERRLAKHEMVVKSLYAVFYLLLLTMAVTGLCLAFEDDYAALKKIHAIREVHAFCYYLILAFIVVHLAGVFLAERKDGKGIVSDMINGGSQSNQP